MATFEMQSCLFDLLLRAYLTERSKTIDPSQLSLPSPTQLPNALSSLEKIYQNVEGSALATIGPSQAEESEPDEPIVDKDNGESSQISITVCDEPNNLKRQFFCNRSLLIREMRYFADYLKDEPDQAEEVDISVHCDISIFQWLMSFVNRRSSAEVPELNPSIAVSILISSDFLKMDKLVPQTLDYIHKHTKEILATNCNIACIPDALYRKLAKYYSDPYEIEQIQEKKNRFKGKLFECHLIQLLTETKVVRCQHCQTILTVEQLEVVPCLRDRFILMPNGKLHFQHQIDSKFVINEWIREVHARGQNSWRNTFWLVWLLTHGDQCARCEAYFRYIDFCTCSYHPVSLITDGKYDCCSQPSDHFDIFQVNVRSAGCQQREHICQNQNQCSQIYENLDKEELLKHHPTLQLVSHRSFSSNLRTAKILEQSIYGSAETEVKKGSLRTAWTPLLDTHPWGAEMKYAWDATKSTRWNQDAQREDEHRRFDEILRHIQGIQQTTKASSTRTQKETIPSSLVSPGGIYCRIENEWRTRQSTPVTQSTNNVNKTRQRTTLK